MSSCSPTPGVFGCKCRVTVTTVDFMLGVGDSRLLAGQFTHGFGRRNGQIFRLDGVFNTTARGSQLGGEDKGSSMMNRIDVFRGLRWVPYHLAWLAWPMKPMTFSPPHVLILWSFFF